MYTNYKWHSAEKLDEEIGESRHAMSYHRGGQTGAVAVSYSTSPMPHSPNRRYSSGTGSGSTTTSGIGTTSKFNTYRSAGTSSLLDRPTTSFYSPSPTGLHSSYISSEYRRSYCAPGSFYSSASTGTSIRRNYSSEYSRSNCSPARSVSSSSYSETGGGAATSTSSVNGRYISSTSSASSSSRERSSVDAAADIISRYSPASYVPNIQRQQQTNTGSAHHWRHRSTSSSLSELFGGDEREVERRDLRPESSLSSSSSSSSAAVAIGAIGPWSKSNKRRPISTNSTVPTIAAGHARADSAVSLAEVTTIIDDDHITRKLNDDDDDNTKDTNDDQHNNNGNISTNGQDSNDEDIACGYGINNNDNDDNDKDEDNDDDNNDDDNLNNHHFHQQRCHQPDEEGNPTNRSSRNRLQISRDERCGLNGLRNIGNTCFMNSVIQCLSNTRPLLEYLLNEQYLADINTTTSSMKGALIKAFSQVIHELWEVGGDHVVNTTALKSQIQRFAPRFMGYSQQDAQEFLRYLLEGLHEDVNRIITKLPPIHGDIPDSFTDMQKAVESWKRYLRSEDSMIVDVFVGQLRSSLHCTSCDHVSVTLDPFWDLSLPIPGRSGTVKLSQCLEHFTREEVLDGDEKPTCSKCQMRRKCTKSFSIQKFPKILVIHLKRFSPMERFRGKLNVMVDFPLTGLDLSAFAAPRVPGCTYNLYGVANHSGTTYSGHYTAYCKHPYSGEWHEYNDSRVSVVSARSVVSSEAYVLFYEQQPHSSHL
ncbi:ubiquitin carboxyl-terminal hydrolase Usp2-like isoform X7 [Cataglyphis hispanica]|uniref:ubiquitin carboxyl-terminal hydrolase Usp2-like isoform X7 n=1 Tax=Cataglyphis hispanica TaxID=1086592 RepID=UPI0021802D92|nr:ubiquitin carboxyl-terminal hydrolase Usp2-like isoform X7 [Cataglyphis hispanica]